MDDLLTRAEVERKTGLSKSTIYRMMRAGNFPLPVRVGQRAVRWPASAIADYLRACPESEGHGIPPVKKNERRYTAAA